MARARGLDPDAALRVASAEGLSGRIGDGGHAFGPFQVNDAGGVLTNKFPGWSAERKQAWAWSPKGVSFALDGMAPVAKGLHGRAAVENIVRRYERPANPEGEIARALAGSSFAGSSSGRTPGPEPGGGGSTPSPAASPSPDYRRQLLLALAQTTSQQQPDYTPFLDLLRQRSQSASSLPAVKAGATPGPVAASPSAPAPATGHAGSLAELLHEGVGGPTHSTGEHIHAASTNPQTVLALIAEAQRRGMSVRENPYVDPVDPVHAPRSYHKRNFPGRFNGRKLGEALDVSGPGMGAYEAWARKTYGGVR